MKKKLFLGHTIMAGLLIVVGLCSCRLYGSEVSKQVDSEQVMYEGIGKKIQYAVKTPEFLKALKSLVRSFDLSTEQKEMIRTWFKSVQFQLSGKYLWLWGRAKPTEGQIKEAAAELKIDIAVLKEYLGNPLMGDAIMAILGEAPLRKSVEEQKVQEPQYAPLVAFFEGVINLSKFFMLLGYDWGAESFELKALIDALE